MRNSRLFYNLLLRVFRRFWIRKTYPSNEKSGTSARQVPEYCPTTLGLLTANHTRSSLSFTLAGVKQKVMMSPVSLQSKCNLNP